MGLICVLISRYVAGCVLSCNDADACNSAQTKISFPELAFSSLISLISYYKL